MDEWMEALRLVADGEPSAFIDLTVSNLPLIVQERARLVLSKLPRHRPASNATTRLAEAVLHFEAAESSVPYKTLIDETCARFDIKRPAILTHALNRKRQDVNAELRRRFGKFT